MQAYNDEYSTLSAPPETVVLDRPRLERADAAQINAFEDCAKRPDDVRSIIEGMEEERKYVHTDANLPTTEGGVATNYLLRYQWIHRAQIYAKDPSVAVRPKRKLGMLVPGLQRLILDFGATCEYLIQHFAEEGKLRATLDGAIQDTDTVGIAFLSLSWLEDEARDPAGVYRPQDFAASVRKLKRLAEQIANGDFAEDSAEAAELKDLTETVRKQSEAEKWREVAYPTKKPMLGPDGQPVMGDGGIPAFEDVEYPEGEDPRKLRWEGIPTAPQITQLPKYRGFTFDVYDPEDVFWDWRIKKPEHFGRTSYLMLRHWLTDAEIREQFNLSADDDVISKVGIGQANEAYGVKAEEPERKGDCYCVWERRDRANNCIYWWVQGSSVFLKKETPEVVTSNWYNVFPVYFNRVTGRLLPISNTTIGRPLQDEINTVRTHKRQAKRAAYDRHLFEQDLFDEEEQQALREMKPNSWTPTKRPVEEIGKKIMSLKGQFDAQVHDVTEERQELSALMNISQAAQGVTKDGADSATEAAIANQTSGQMADQHRSNVEELLQEVFRAMGEMLVQALPEDNAKAIAGPGAVWPMIDREALWNALEIDIEAGSTGKPDQMKRLEALKEAVGIGQAAGMGADPSQPRFKPVALIRKLADIMDWRDDPEELVEYPALPPMGAPPMGGGPAGPAGAPEPEAQPGGPMMAEPAQDVAPLPTLAGVAPPMG